MTDCFPSELTENLRGVNEQKIKLHCALFGPSLENSIIVFCAQYKRGMTIINGYENILQLMTEKNDQLSEPF